ncbi:type I-E CRISPR-associated protein Cas5/CasD [Peptococcus simiae]|uniref:Type I-E CRISPR-associated protein Cas5/CasD n=1 Tax=Peptococcus simiae TaxID=1643805 RepID=A0ABW9H0G1_9FIRM
MKTILLKCAGPLQAWGTASYFESRMTDLYPSKSAIIGLLAACCGFRRDEDAEIQKLNDLNFAVRVDRQGTLLRDYHIAQKYKNSGAFDRTYVTNRYYLQDAIFIVSLAHDDEHLLDRLVEAIKAPYFQPFMGRRSLPVPADFLIGTFEGSPLEVLETYPAQGLVSVAGETHKTLTVYADAQLCADQHGHQWRQDVPLSFNQKNRQFGYRLEGKTRLTVPIRQAATEHDAFGAIGG